MTKKYRLITEREYDRWQEQRDKSDPDQTQNVIDSKLPDDIKMKFLQDINRRECYEDDKAKQLIKMGAPSTSIKMVDAGVQHAEERSASPIPTVQTNSTSTSTCTTQDQEEPSKSTKRKADVVEDVTEIPSTSKKDTAEFEKRNMIKIAKYLSTLGIGGNKEGLLVIKSKAIEGSNFVSVIRQMTDARCRRSKYTTQVMDILRKLELPDGIFSAGIMNIIKGPSSSKCNTSVNMNTSLKWDAY